VRKIAPTPLPVLRLTKIALVRAFEAMVNIAVEGLASIEVVAPFLLMSKTDIVRLGDQLKVPFERTWSCYKGGALHCGRCGTCVERREAFVQAEVADPTVYESESALAG